MKKALIKANAKKEIILYEFTEVLRDLLRGISAMQDSSGGLYRATQNMNYVMQLIENCEEPITWYELFSTAVANLRPSDNLSPYETAYVHAALSGMSMLTEMTCLDNAARGRASKRQSTFRSCMQYVVGDKG